MDNSFLPPDPIDQEAHFANLIDRFENGLKSEDGRAISELEFIGLALGVGIKSSRIHAELNRIRMLDGVNA